MHYKDQPPNDFLKEFVALVASHPGIALASVKFVQDSSPSTQSASPATAPPPPKKTKKGCPTNIILCIAGKLVGINFWRFGKLYYYRTTSKSSA